jgi:hypothetical protein
MGGLLDKANAAKEPETEAAAEPEPVLAAEPASVTPVTKVSTPDDGDSLFSQFSKPGLALGGLAFVLTWFLGSYSLEDLTGPVPFGLVVLLMFVGSFYLVWQSVDREKTVVLAVGYLLLAGVPYGAGLLNDGFVGITDVAFSEEGDDLTFKIRGSFNSVDVSIRADGVEMWTESGDLSNEIKNFRAPIEDFFAGNGEFHDGSPDVEYTIYAESSNGLTGEISIPSKLVTRQAEDAGVRINALQGFQDNNEYLGITVNILVGLINPNLQNSNGGGFQAVGLRPMNGDYTIDVSITGGDTWRENTISVDESSATWVSKSPGIGAASTDGWMELTGTDEEDQTGTLYVDKNEFYDGPACYSFNVDIVNVVNPDQTFTTTWSWEIDLESGDDEAGIDKGEGIGETC